MSKIVGLFKGLTNDEDVVFASKSILPTIFIKEAYIKKLIGRERKEVPISYAMTKCYLTNKRLVFLILYQIETRIIAQRGAPILSGVTGTWFEMPISAVKNVDIKPVFIRKDREMMRLVEWGIIPDVDRATAVELIYDERMAVGRIKDYMESMLKMGFFTKLFKKIERISDKLLIIDEEMASITPTLRSAITVSARKPSLKRKIYCRNCGTENTEDAIFCVKCGKQITERAT